MTRQLQPLSAENIGDLYTLYFSVYGRKRTPGYFEKKYSAIYPEHPPLGFIAYQCEVGKTTTAIGFYGAIPCFLFCGEEKVLAAQCADAMTHPGFRRQGLFLQLAERTTAACRQSGIRLLFGFPNQYSLPGFLNKLGWEKGEQMDCFRVPVPGFPLKRIANGLFITGGSYNKYADFILTRYYRIGDDDTPEPARTVMSGLYRDDAWMEQKRKAGMRQLKLGGNTCWVRIADDLLVGDLTGEPVSVGRNLERLKKIARRLGLAAIQFHCSPGTPLHVALLQQGRATPSYTIVYRDFGAGLSLKALKFTLADIDHF